MQDERTSRRLAAAVHLPRIRIGRVIALSLTGLFLVLAAWELPLMLGLLNTGPEWTRQSDYNFYRVAAEHWLSTGSFYMPEQLAGPYEIVLDKVVLYPPIALYLFTPFALGVPGQLFWAIPIGVLGYAFWQWRPAMWTWPFLAAILFWHATLSDLLLGNTDLWVAAGIAGGLLWGWPAVFVVLKPPFALFALVGMRHRSWWLAAAAALIASIPMAPLWFDYLTTLRNSGVPWTYSLPTLPLVVSPLIAWLGRTTDRERAAPLSTDRDGADASEDGTAGAPDSQSGTPDRAWSRLVRTAERFSARRGVGRVRRSRG